MCRFVNDRVVSSSATLTLNVLCLISIPEESLKKSASLTVVVIIALLLLSLTVSFLLSCSFF